MKPRILSVALLTVALLAPRGGHALELSGWVGGRGNRLDYWTPEASSDLRLHLDAGLSARGYVLAPGEIDWGANATYGRNQGNYGESDREESILTYRGTLSLFDTRTSRLSLTLTASRDQFDFSQTSALTPEMTGTTLMDVLAFRARTNGGATYPSVEVAGSWTDSTNTGYGRDDVTREAKQLSAAVRHGGELLNYELTYLGRLEESSLDALNYVTHTMGVNAKSAITTSTDLGINAVHFVRDPGNDVGTNPSYEDSRLSAFSTTALPGFTGRVQYDFGHLLLESTAIPTQERFGHTLTAMGDVPLSREWTLLANAGGSSRLDRSGDVETSAAGEKLAAGLRWNRPGSGGALVLEAAGRVGLLQPDTGPNEFGWGTTGSVRYSRGSGGLQYSGAYKAEYDENMDAVQGWSLAQSVVADVSSPLGSATLRSSIQVDARRSHAVPFGDSASRTATLRTALGWRSYQVAAQGSLSDGVAGSLDNPLRGDGLFVPVGFETRSRTAALSLSASPTRRWTAHALARYASVSGPEFPTQRELLLLGRIGYQVGELVLALENRYTATGRETLDLRTNELMMSLTRHFHL